MAGRSEWHAKLSKENGKRSVLRRRLRDASTDDLLISQENLDVNVDIQSPSDGVRCQPPFINQRRNDQPFSVIPALFFRVTASTQAAGG